MAVVREEDLRVGMLGLQVRALAEPDGARERESRAQDHRTLGRAARSR
jgi:hypothetical protein